MLELAVPQLLALELAALELAVPELAAPELAVLELAVPELLALELLALELAALELAALELAVPGAGGAGVGGAGVGGAGAGGAGAGGAATNGQSTVPSLADLVMAELLVKKFQSAGTALLILHIQQSGGGYMTKSNLWTFFGGAKLFHSGGTIATFALISFQRPVKCWRLELFRCMADTLRATTLRVRSMR